MKKNILFIAAISALSLASCKKDHTCTCTSTSTEPGSTTTTNVFTITDAKKGDAKKACISSTEVDGAYTETTTCELK
ncbi:MAG: hypothetical protein WAQ28_11060 [Bacteroidia bacterium]|jgi:hypothetical protein